MHFVGKILVVVMLVLSIMFMMLAGAVYTAHMNWRTEADKQKKAAADAMAKHGDVQTQIEAVKRELTAKLTAAEQNAAHLDAARKGLEQDVTRLRKEVGDLGVARKTASEQALIAGQESKAR